MDRRVVNSINLLQNFRKYQSHDLSTQDLKEISTDFNCMYNRLQLLKHEQFSVFEFPEFVQYLKENNIPAVQKSLEGAIREYDMVIRLYARLEKTDNEPRTLRNSNQSSMAKDHGKNKAIPDMSERNRTDVNEADIINDRKRTLSDDPTLPQSSRKAHTPESVTNKSSKPVYNRNSRTAPETNTVTMPADNRSSRTAPETNISTTPANKRKSRTAPETNTGTTPAGNRNSRTAPKTNTGTTPADNRNSRTAPKTNTGTTPADNRNSRTALKKHTATTSVDEIHRSKALLRRSEEASLLLHQGNPNIADLSDINRPTNLAERFSELYSNEYTDSFEFLQEQGQEEEHIVYDLLRIVRHAYKYCRQLATKELTKRIHNMRQEQMQASGLALHDKADIMAKGLAAKQLKEDSKNIKYDTFLYKEYWNLIPKEIEPTNEKLVTYAWNCLDIVWFMCVQDPPISLSWVRKGDIFDNSLYRGYTKAGATVDFCVWPVVRLVDNGPVLTRGIAQGKKDFT